MPTGPLPENIQRFLVAPRPSVVGWVRRDGGAATAPVWFRFVDGAIELSMEADGPRAHQLRREPRLSLSVLGDSWYSQVTLHCRAHMFVADTEFEVLDALSVHYTGEPYSDHTTRCITVTAAVERWHTFGEI
ncbi:MAG TPA: pyridoxamine 5'-phosphate oxidase family protein [Solirubrobacteraceae bacterium]|nr:pyridoxamine 5'-phosphate oxidase family protein [Solirubrobacteraceae bacterium]